MVPLVRRLHHAEVEGLAFDLIDEERWSALVVNDEVGWLLGNGEVQAYEPASSVHFIFGFLPRFGHRVWSVKRVDKVVCAPLVCPHICLHDCAVVFFSCSGKAGEKAAGFHACDLCIWELLAQFVQAVSAAAPGVEYAVDFGGEFLGETCQSPAGGRKHGGV